MEAKLFHLTRTKNSRTIYEIRDISSTVVFQVLSLVDRSSGTLQLVNQSGATVFDISPVPNSGESEFRPTFEFKKDGKLILNVVKPFGGTRLEGDGPLGQLVLDSDEIRKPGRFGFPSYPNNNFEISWKIRDAYMNRCGYIRSEDDGLLSYSIEVIGEADLYSILGLAVLLAEELERISKIVIYD